MRREATGEAPVRVILMLFRFLRINFSATPLLHQRFPVGGGRPVIENVGMVAGGAAFPRPPFADPPKVNKSALATRFVLLLPAVGSK